MLPIPAEALGSEKLSSVGHGIVQMGTVDNLPISLSPAVSVQSSPAHSPRGPADDPFLLSSPLLSPVPATPPYNGVLDIRIAQLLQLLMPSERSEEQRRKVFSAMASLVKKHFKAEVLIL